MLLGVMNDLRGLGSGYFSFCFDSSFVHLMESLVMNLPKRIPTFRKPVFFLGEASRKTAF